MSATASWLDDGTWQCVCGTVCQPMWLQCSCGRQPPPKPPSAEVLADRALLQERRAGWADWRALRAASTDGAGFTWQFAHPVPVYYQGSTFDLRVNTPWGSLAFVSDEGEINPGTEENDFPRQVLADMRVSEFRTHVSSLLDLSEGEASQIVLTSQEGAVLADDHLVTKEAQGESDSGEEND